MLVFLVDSVLFFALLLWLPKLLWDWVFKKDKSLLVYLGFYLPKARPISDTRPCFLFYAVSMGETKAASSLFFQIKKTYPDACFYVMSRTLTGHEEAKRSLPGADGHFLLPFDFSWNASKIVTRLRPKAIIVVESDLWFNLLSIAKSYGTKVFMVSARISERSCCRFSKVPFFSKRLFSCFTAICAQNELYQKRFVLLGADPAHVFVTGNLKWNVQIPRSDRNLINDLGLKKEDFILVIGSTHEGEEEQILERLAGLLQDFFQLKLILVPRHPQRFAEVRQLLCKQGLPFIAFSAKKEKTGKERVILVDEMGILCDLYKIADLAIVAGSFISNLEGHNILEPIQMGAPVLFGPYMNAQKDLVETVLQAEAGEQVDLSSLAQKVRSLLTHEKDLKLLREKGRMLTEKTVQSSASTWQRLISFI